ncbi:Predicted arabinose efflux permease, MFS family [Actinopolyspora alba]|uniref:Predicted arabinose efflux permease, MFS family n=2 Tax=Actinopolyspora alba TaxID=673379 RepID=A0A1I1XHY9_9ACTN|nr:Predicted arabinose efflux permease, MFS family [Actinopolyspora alba]
MMPEAMPLTRDPVVRLPKRAMSSVAVVVTVGILPAFLVGGLGVQLQQDFGFGPAVLGAGAAGFFAVAALSSRLMGWLSERIGPVPAMRLAAVGSAVCAGGIATSRNLGWLLAMLWLAGLPNALGQPASNLLIARCVPANRRATAFGIKQSAIPASTLLAGLAVPAVALTFSWRWAFAGAALVGMCAALSVPRSVIGHGGSAIAAGRESVEPGRGVLLLITLAAGLASAAANSLGSFVTTTGVQVGFGPGAAGLVLAVGSVAGLCMRLAMGVLADRRNPNPIVVITLLLLIGSAGFVLMALPLPVAFLIGAVVGFGAGWSWPGLLNFAVAGLYPRRVAGATSVSQTGVYIGGSAGPLLFGVVASHAGLAEAWSAAGVVALLAAVSLWIVWRRTTVQRAH